MLSKKQLESAKKWMLENLSDEKYNDCNELNSTLLAEDCADDLDMYEGDDFDIPEELFELAVSDDICAMFERSIE